MEENAKTPDINSPVTKTNTCYKTANQKMMSRNNHNYKLSDNRVTLADAERRQIARYNPLGK